MKGAERLEMKRKWSGKWRCWWQQLWRRSNTKETFQVNCQTYYWRVRRNKPVMHFIERIDFFGKLVHSRSSSRKRRAAESWRKTKGHMQTLGDGERFKKSPPPRQKIHGISPIMLWAAISRLREKKNKPCRSTRCLSCDWKPCQISQWRAEVLTVPRTGSHSFIANYNLIYCRINTK